MSVVGLYRVGLRVLPRGFRARYGAEMLRMFEAHWLEAAGAGRVFVLLRALRDLAWTAVIVRLSSEYATAKLEAAGGGSGMLVGFSVDVRAALRALARRPGFTATAVLTVALGIGAAVAVFSVVDGTVLRGLVLPDRERVVGFWTSFDNQPNNRFLVSAAEQADLGDLKSFDRVGAWHLAETTLTDATGGDSRTIGIALTMGDLYALVGARTVLGRLPNESDNRPGAARVALLSHALWVQWYGGRADLIGTQSIRIDTDETALIIGVLERDVQLLGTTADVWVHDVLDPADYSWGRSGHGRSVIARLRPDVTLAQARAEIGTIERAWAFRYASQHSIGLEGHRLRVESITDLVLGGARRVALLLSGATALLLALACANVANLLLARAETRTSEVGVRLALGSSRLRVARPVLIESLALSLGGGLFGCLLAWLGMPALLTVAPPEIAAIPLVVNVRLIAFAVAISFCTGVVFALIPSWHAARRDPATLLRAASRSRTGTTRGLRLLVGAQIALATVLLAAAGLLVRSLLQLNSVNPGLDPNERVTLDLTLPTHRYAETERVLAFYEALQQRVTATRGVQQATVVRHLPLRDAQRRESVLREGETGRENALPVAVQAAGPGVLRTLGILLVAGRDIEPTDRASGTPIVLVNRAAADALWPGQSVIGKRVRATFAPRDYSLITIVGVYDNVRSVGVSTSPTPEIILPVAQGTPWGGWIRNLTLVLQTSGDAATVLQAARTAVREIDPSVPAENAGTMEAVVRTSMARERFLAALLTVFAILALVIAAVGVFGVVSFTVARQRREFAIRNALGAPRSQILRAVLLNYAAIAAAGAALGTLVAISIAPMLGGFLYNIAPRDQLVLTSVPITLVLAALVAAMVPAVRATRVPPAHALRENT